MNANQKLYYAFGKVLYAIAMADGAVQREEHEKVHDIIKEKMISVNADFAITEAIFHLVKQEGFYTVSIYDDAVKELEEGRHYLTKELSYQFLDIAFEIADAFPPLEPSEMLIVNKFRKDLNRLITKLPLR